MPRVAGRHKQEMRHAKCLHLASKVVIKQFIVPLQIFSLPQPLILLRGFLDAQEKHLLTKLLFIHAAIVHSLCLMTIRKIFGAIKGVAFYCNFMNQPPNFFCCQQTLKSTVPTPPKHLSSHKTSVEIKRIHQ